MDSQLNIKMYMSLSLPRVLSAGKDGWIMFQAAVEHDEILRLQLNSGGIAISWYLQDGLHHAGLSRRLGARHALLYEVADQEGDDLGGPLARELDWDYCWLCSSHVGSNAVKWGMDALSSPEVLDDISLGILSLRNTSEECLKLVR